MPPSGPSAELTLGRDDARNHALHDMNFEPGWAKRKPGLYPSPTENYEPCLWSWQSGKVALDEAGTYVDHEHAERRNLVLANPLVGNTYGTLRTLVIAYQMILPGETARSHRHTPNAGRFILQSEDAYTIVDGEKLEMRNNDVLLTPNWSWHGHISESDQPSYWLDFLDVPLVQLLEPMFFEPNRQTTEEIIDVPGESKFIFRWEDIQRSLDAATADPEGVYGTRVRLESDSMPTTGLFMERLETGAKTRRHRTTANHAFIGVEGSGEIIVGDETFTWQRGDVIAVPAWRPFEHRSKNGGTLFVVNDQPVMEAFGWLRTEF